MTDSPAARRKARVKAAGAEVALAIGGGSAGAALDVLRARSEGGGGFVVGALRARSRIVRFVFLLIHFTPDFLSYSVLLCVKRQRDRTLHPETFSCAIAQYCAEDLQTIQTRTNTFLFLFTQPRRFQKP